MGIPMQIRATDGLAAECVAGGRAELVDLSLTGPLPADSWVLVFLGAAREVLTPERAEQITRALAGLGAVMAGGDAGDAFADLDAAGPRLPPHLAAAHRAGRATG